MASGGKTASTLGSDCYDYRSWWLLPTIAGDAVRIDWESETFAFYGGPYLNVFSVGTTDFNFSQDRIVASQDVSEAHPRNELKFKAMSTGPMPLELFVKCAHDGGDGVGPYDFTTYVQHAVRLALPSQSYVRNRGRYRVTVRDPSGQPIADPRLAVVVEARRGKRWVSVGRGTAATAGSVTLTLSRALRGHTTKLRARAFGPGYLTATTASRMVRVSRA